MAFFSHERHLEIWFPKKETITFFWSKLHYTKKDQILHVKNYIFPKTRGNKNKQWTHITPLSLNRHHQVKYECIIFLGKGDIVCSVELKTRYNKSYYCLQKIN